MCISQSAFNHDPVEVLMWDMEGVVNQDKPISFIVGLSGLCTVSHLFYILVAPISLLLLHFTLELLDIVVKWAPHLNI